MRRPLLRLMWHTRPPILRRLPPEVRLKIYEHVLVQTDSVPNMYIRRRHPQVLALQLVCKTFWNETLNAADIFIEGNTFEFRHLGEVEYFVRTTSLQALASIRRIRVRDIHNYVSLPFLGRFPRLTELLIDFEDYDWFDWDEDLFHRRTWSKWFDDIHLSTKQKADIDELFATTLNDMPTLPRGVVLEARGVFVIFDEHDFRNRYRETGSDLLRSLWPFNREILVVKYRFDGDQQRWKKVAVANWRSEPKHFAGRNMARIERHEHVPAARRRRHSF